MMATPTFRIKTIAVLAVLLVLIGLIRARIIGLETQHTDETAAARSMLLARAFAERARTVIQKVNLTLEIASSHWNNSEQILQARFKEIVATMGNGPSRVELWDDRGKLRAGAQSLSTHSEEGVSLPVPPLSSLSDNRWSVSEPVPGPEPGSWRVRFSRPVVVADQRVGIASVILDPNVCLAIYSELGLGEGDVVALTRSDGTLLARAPALKAGIGRKIPDARFLMPGSPDNGSMTRIAPIDGVLRKNGWYRPPDLPLVFVVGLSLERVHDQLALRELRINTAAGVVVLLLLLTAVLLVREREARDRRAAELSTEKETLEREVESRTRSLRQALEEVRSAQDALNESERRGRLILENTLDMIVLFRSQAGRLRAVYRSPSIELKFPQDTHDDLQVFPRIHPEDAAGARAAWRAVLRGKSPVSCEYRVLPADGGVHWLQTTIVLVRSPDGAVEGAVAVARDVSLQKQSELRLRESEERLRQITDHSGDLISLFALDGTRLYTSPSYSRYFPENPKELAWNMRSGTRPREQDKEALLEAARKATIERTPQRIEFCLLGEGGAEHWFEGDVRALFDQSGRPYRVLSICRDITERRRSEQRMHELQRMEAIGQLTGGLAHDFNNMLGLVVGNLDLLGERMPQAPELRRPYELALEAALRAAEVTRVLLAVARRQPMAISRKDINALVRELLPLVHASAGASVSVSTELSNVSLECDLDPSGLNNVILNLVINACDAMRSNSNARELRLSTRLDSGDAVIEVKDNGQGMSEEVRAHALEPFFTTKDRAEGTGLGLSMAKGYVEQLGGTIALSSRPGEGTTVTLTLPLATDALHATGRRHVAPVVEASGSSRAYRILVVDDELGICELACTWLASLGHMPVGVHDAQQALARIDEGFDMLFTDVVMPGGMDGVALARACLERQPALKVLLTSGYARNLVDDAAQLPGPLLNKPYRRPDLEKAIQGLSAGRAAGAGPA